jgi:hypothetical protein
MTSIARVIQSRNRWKHLAVDRRKDAESKARQAKNWRARSQELQKKNLALTGEINELKKKALVTNGTKIHITVNVVAIFLFIQGVISCRAVSRVLSFLQWIEQIAIAKCPHHSSVANWVCRAGLGVLKNVKPMPERWVAIIDTSISYCSQKLLVVLRIPLSHFQDNNCSPGLCHVECIGLVLGRRWNGDTVSASLKDIFAKVGFPSAILKDGGADLMKGVRLLGEEVGGIASIRDIGHVTANTLKKMYAKDVDFIKYLKLIDKIKHRLCQTDLSFLRPPKIRTKGRFQSISRVIEWSKGVLPIITGRRRIKNRPHLKSLQKAASMLKRHHGLIRRFSRDCCISNSFMKVLKEGGLNQATYQSSSQILEKLPKNSPLRKSLSNWLSQHIRIQCQLSIKQTPLIVSSDAIETLMGEIKHIIERNPTAEFGKMALATPLLCGNHSVADIEGVLESTKHRDLQEWIAENTKNSHRRQKERVFPKLARPRKSPDPLIAKAA